jgi:oligoendopeptidase F
MTILNRPRSGSILCPSPLTAFGGFLFLLFIAICPDFAFAADDAEHRWNLDDLYPSVEKWNADAAQADAQLKQFASCKGHLGDSATRLKSCLHLSTDIQKRLARLSIYASETHNGDTSLAAGLELQQKARLLASRVGEAASFVGPEILAIGKGELGRLFAQNGGLKIYRHYIDDILRSAPHTLDANGEQIIAMFGLATDSPGSTYSILPNADIPWPKVKLSDGSEVVLDSSGYTKYRVVGNREDRKMVFNMFGAAWKQYERTFGLTYYSQLKTDLVYSKVRHYPDSQTRALDGNKLPPAIYNTLIEQTNANLATLHRYFKLRAKLLGVTDIGYYDIYPPLVSSDHKYPIDEGKQLMLDAAKPLGPAYVAAMEKGLQNRWMDVYPRPHKLAGAHMAGQAYDVHPYLLLNYNDNYEAVSTLAHEWGHAMHSDLANHAQPFVNANYPIFIAEIASTLNEALLLDHMLKIAKNDDERMLYLGSALEGLRGTFFRQAMFAEFERDVHARVDKGESLTGEAITRIYGDILRRYHGDKEGIVHIDDLYTVEWAYIPHFYRSYYVFQVCHFDCGQLVVRHRNPQRRTRRS